LVPHRSCVENGCSLDDVAVPSERAKGGLIAGMSVTSISCGNEGRPRNVLRNHPGADRGEPFDKAWVRPQRTHDV